MGIRWATYEFEVLNMDGLWKDVGGIYIFSGEKDNLWRAYYIGSTDSFQARHPNHERLGRSQTSWGHPCPCEGRAPGGCPGIN